MYSLLKDAFIDLKNKNTLSLECAPLENGRKYIHVALNNCKIEMYIFQSDRDLLVTGGYLEIPKWFSETEQEQIRQIFCGYKNLNYIFEPLDGGASASEFLSDNEIELLKKQGVTVSSVNVPIVLVSFARVSVDALYQTVLDTAKANKSVSDFLINAVKAINRNPYKANVIT